MDTDPTALSDDQIRKMVQTVERDRKAAFGASWQGSDKTALPLPHDNRYGICLMLAVLLGLYNVGVTGWVLYERYVQHLHVMRPSTFYVQQMACISVELLLLVQCQRIRAAERKRAASPSG